MGRGRRSFSGSELQMSLDSGQEQFSQLDAISDYADYRVAASADQL